MPRLAFRPLALLAIMGFIAAVVGAQSPKSRPLDEDTARVVVNLLELGHMAKPKIDDETAKKWCQNFLKDLDPQKYYFLKADVDEFMGEATTLDDKIKEGNLDFPKKVFARFLERTDERLKTALEDVNKKQDYTIDESIDDDPDLIDYPATAEEANASVGGSGSNSTCSSSRSTKRTRRKRSKRSRFDTAIGIGSFISSICRNCLKSTSAV